jgi:hypothetical protein
MSLPCPLCMTCHEKQNITGADQRNYYLCGQCSLIFVDPSHHLSVEDEKQHYVTHENHIGNEGYVRFLNQVLEPALPLLNHPMRALDYGCGPGPTLSQLLRAHRITCDNYDPFFTRTSVHPPYEIIFATECFEHFFYPEKEMQQIYGWLKPGGLLGIMTERWSTIEHFKSWYYTKDPTHVCFYHEKTFDYLCRRYGLVRIWQDARRVSIFRRFP